MENIELAYSMFNQYLFQDAKNNIDDIEYYFQTNPGSMGNFLIDQLVSAIRTYNYDSIDSPLFKSIVMKSGKSSAEGDKIVADLVQWKNYTKEQIEPARKYLQDVCANSIIEKAKRRYTNSPSELLKFLKTVNFKTASVDVMQSTSFNQVDIASLLQDSGNDGVPSRYPWINQSFQPKEMYERGQMIMVSMAPGCFTGDTKVWLWSTDNVVTLKELAESGATQIPVFSRSENGAETSLAASCVLTKYVTELLKLYLSDGGVVRCTPDHRFMLENGEYCQARDLVPGMKLMPFGQIDVVYVVDKEIETLDTPEPVYDIVDVEKYGNFTIRTSPGCGVVVHNCGKSLFAQSEALYMASMGFKVHYLALGDLSTKDFIVRMGAMFSGMNFGDTYNNLAPIYDGINKVVGSNLDLTILPAGHITVDEYIDFIEDKTYDVLFIDYDSNFKSNAADNMYSEYGAIYEKLTKLTMAGKIVFILAQPKVGVWGNEAIELQDVGESSRKQH